MRIIELFSIFLWILLSVCRVNAQDYEEKISVETFAGSGFEGFKDGNALEARFKSPNGLAVDAYGNVYVADSRNHRIRKITVDGKVVTIAGTGFSGNSVGKGTRSLLNWPAGVAVDKNGNVYIADYGNHCIKKLLPNGDLILLAGKGIPGYKDGKAEEALFNNPIGVYVDYTNNLFIIESKNHTIRKIDTEGMVSTVAGKGGIPGFRDGFGTQSRLDTPIGMCMDRYGNFYVVDSRNQAIRRLMADGNLETVLDNKFTGYKNLSGKQLMFMHSEGSGGGICSGPLDVFYIADGGAYCIFKVDIQKKEITRYAGTGVPGFKDHEIATEAQFNRPVEVCMDLKENLYISDIRNFVVRKVKYQKIKKEIPVEKKIFLNLQVIDGTTKKPISVPVSVTQKNEDFHKDLLVNGKYPLEIKKGSYFVNVDTKGFMPFQTEVTIEEDSKDLIIELSPIKKGAIAVLNNIYFAPNSSSLTVDALEGLNQLVHFLKENHEVKIRISGHTDIGSTQEFNMQLSTARAKAVRDYIVQMGIPSNRVEWRGYGNTKPIADNNTVDGRKKNRRIEIEIIE
jgi:outer membrane protein OmpA-like peptidoglycan-associated protein